MRLELGGCRSPGDRRELASPKPWQVKECSRLLPDGGRKRSNASAQIPSAKTISIDLSERDTAAALAKASGAIGLLVNCAGASTPLGNGGSEGDWRPVTGSAASVVAG